MKHLERREQILLSLGNKLGFATRKQLQAIHSLGGQKNASRILNDMKEYLHVKKGREHVYYLNQKGRELIGCDKELKWTIQAEHYLLRNDMYIYFNCPSDWRIEQKIKFRYQVEKGLKETALVPDATFTVNNQFYFVEVDRTQSMKENIQKIKQYSLLKDTIIKHYKIPPVLIFYTSTEYRKKELTNLCDKANLNFKVLSTTDIQ